MLNCSLGAEWGFGGGKKLAVMGYRSEMLDYSLEVEYATFKLLSAGGPCGGGGGGGGGRPYDCMRHRGSGLGGWQGATVGEGLVCKTPRCARAESIVCRNGSSSSDGGGGSSGEDEERIASGIREIVREPLQERAPLFDGRWSGC